MKNLGKKLVSVVLLSWSSAKVFADTVGLSEVNSALEAQKSNITKIADIILWILLIIAFIYMITNLIFKYQEQKNSVVTFIVVLLLFGIFKVITGNS